MAKAKDPMQGVEVVRKATRRPKPSMRDIDPEAIRRQVAPLADRLPSQEAPAASALTTLPPDAPPISGEVLPPEPETLDEFDSAISEELVRARKSYLRIGALLSAADETLPPEQRAELVKRLGARFDVKKSALTQMMTAYRAIRSERVPEVVASAGYTAVYMLANLSDAERTKAKRAGLFRSGVRQADVRAFVKELKATNDDTARKAELEAELERLLKRVEKVREELAQFS
jgi:hypothetical protein